MILGIDLGTTYSVGAYIDTDGKEHVIQNAEGDVLTPSVVLIEDADHIVVGEAAKDSIAVNPDQVISAAKNLMGERHVFKKYGNKEFTPEVVSSFILRKITEDAERNTGEKVEGVIITVPAYFNDAQRKATEDAAALAGLKLFGMINEPTAAAISYIRQSHLSGKKLLIYDLGGGTFDATILDVKDDSHINVISTDGLKNAGGRFFDESILEHVCDIFREKYDIDLEDEEYLDEFEELFLKAEKAKQQLSAKMETAIPMRVGKVRESIILSREDFNDMISATYDRTRRKIDGVIKEAGLTKEDIDIVLLVGGSSRIPYIREQLTSYFGKEPASDINPDEAVAIGAAHFGKNRDGGGEAIHFADVCSHSLGVVILNKNNEEENETIIPRNSSIPVKKTKRFSTSIDQQGGLPLKLTEGEYKELTDVTILAEQTILFPKPVPQKGSPIILTLELDEQQLLHLRLSLPDIDFEDELHIPRIANMQQEEVVRIAGMLRDCEVS